MLVRLVAQLTAARIVATFVDRLLNRVFKRLNI
jgi:hypothetical protein